MQKDYLGSKARGKTFAYRVNDSIYLNITNRCTNDCTFCLRNNGDTAYGSNSLWLKREPSPIEVLTQVEELFFPECNGFVFCGYGEPTERLDPLIAVAKRVKAKYPELSIRVNTNGLSDLINGRDTARDFEGLFDVVSISLNTSDPKIYKEMCRPKFGGGSHMAIIDFALNVKNYVPRVVLSVVDTTITPEDIEMCRGLAEDIGVEFRLREFI